MSPLSLWPTYQPVKPSPSHQKSKNGPLRSPQRRRFVNQLKTENDKGAGYVRDHDSEANFIEYRTVIGKLMGDMFLDAMSPLYKRFPELLPDYLGGTYKIPESVYLPSF
jgi:hypothetical protein